MNAGSLKLTYEIAANSYVSQWNCIDKLNASLERIRSYSITIILGILGLTLPHIHKVGWYDIFILEATIASAIIIIGVGRGKIMKRMILNPKTFLESWTNLSEIDFQESFIKNAAEDYLIHDNLTVTAEKKLKEYILIFYVQIALVMLWLGSFILRTQ
jgi:hypothetical protein